MNVPFSEDQGTSYTTIKCAFIKLTICQFGRIIIQIFQHENDEK